jgi:hypothetical protein
MRADSLQRKQLLDATERAARASTSVSQLGGYVATATFLANHLAEAGDPVGARIGQALESLEETYAVALDRNWSELPFEAASVVRAALGEIEQLLKTSQESRKQLDP